MLPTVPTVDDLAADPVTHHFDDMIAPTGLTNMLGTVRVDPDLTALSAVQFPPVSQGLTQTAALFVDGRLFASYGVPVTHEWRPDRVVRSAATDGLEIRTTTVCVPGRTAVAIDIEVRNTTDAARTARLDLSVAARVTRAADAWMDAESPSARNAASAHDDLIAFASADAAAWSVQGLHGGEAVLSGVADSPDAHEAGIGGNGRGGELRIALEVPPGGSARAGYVHAVGTSEADAQETYDAVSVDVPAAIVAAEEF